MTTAPRPATILARHRPLAGAPGSDGFREVHASENIRSAVGRQTGNFQSTNSQIDPRPPSFTWKDSLSCDTYTVIKIA